MTISFTIGQNWIEFFLHFFAAFCYLAAGIEMATSENWGFIGFITICGIVLNATGAFL